jgi:outer membrane protein OmpA-like peptidoglycan-associated protein
MSPRRIILYHFIFCCLLVTTVTASPDLATRVTCFPAFSVDSCPITRTTTIYFRPDQTTLSSSAKSSLRQAVSSVLSCDSCSIRLTASEQVNCFPATRKEEKRSVLGWNRAMHAADFLCNTLHFPSDRVIVSFKDNDTSNKMTLNCVSRSESPTIPGPHPNLRKRDTVTVHFDPDQSSLSNNSDSIISSYLRQTGRIDELYIAGYCDNTGTEAYNDQLALRRAQNVDNYLRQQLSDSTTTIYLTAYGTRFPVDNNSTASGRVHNRRVMIVSTPAIQATTTADQPGPTPQCAASAQPSSPQSPIYKALTDTATRIGTSIILKDVVFYGGRHLPLPPSYVALGELLKAMKDNAHVCIRIEGHVCCIPDSTDGPDFDTGQSNLSVQRAKFVYDYLIRQGIPKDRMTFAGLGGSHKLYPDELNPAQESANRRVEIRIVSK